MNSSYYDYDPNMDLRWDNDVKYGHFTNEVDEYQRKNMNRAVITQMSQNNVHRNHNKGEKPSDENIMRWLRMLLWVVLLVIVIYVVMRLVAVNDEPDYPFIDLVYNSFG